MTNEEMQALEKELELAINNHITRKQNLTVEEAALLYGISEGTFKRHADAAKIRYARYGKKRVYNRRFLDEYFLKKNIQGRG